MTFDEIVSDYIHRYRANARAEMRFFLRQSGPSAAIAKAALCMLPSGKRHPHQCRIPRVVLEQAEARLHTAAKRLAVASDFATLHEIVEREIGGIRGIGALTVYDIAHRIGTYFKKIPQRIYLHAGTRGGAALLGLRGESIDRKQLPDAFGGLTAAEIEDCLCIYKDELGCAQEAPAPSTKLHISITRVTSCQRAMY